MAENMSNIMGAGSINILEDFADVVYSYKCKFCDFRSEGMQGMTNHVINIHLPQDKKSVNDQQEQPVIDPTGQVTPQPMQEVVSSVNLQESVRCEPQCESTMTVTTQIDPSMFTRSPSGDLMTSEDTAHNSENLMIVEQTNPSTEADNLTKTSITIEGEGDTHEVFVCGQCAYGFSSIADCKSHIIEEHKIDITDKNSENAVVPVAEVEFIPPNKVSVGTQAELSRRPGRRKKEEVEKAAAAAAAEKDAEADQHLELTDLSLLTPRMSGAGGKRVVRPPKNLVQDYYIGKPKHTVKRRQVNRLTCPTKGCSLKFRLKETLDIHIQSHIVEDKTQKLGFKCIDCDKTMDRWKPMQMHMWTAHQLDTDLCKCKFCDFRADNWQKVDIHAEKHNEESFDCSQCPKTFRCSKSLRKHVREHGEGYTTDPGDETSDTPANTCKICGRSFVTKKILKKHIELIHDKVKPFVCTYCGYSTGRKATLQLHIRTHTGDKPFKCDMCTYQTGDHNTLRRHRMRHTGSRPYQCQFCPYQCIQSISLKTHTKNKHPGVNMFLCTQCQYHTVNKQLYDQHVEEHKRGLIEEVTGSPVINSTKTSKVITQPKPDEMKQITIYQNPSEGSRTGEVHFKVASATSNMISLAAKEADLIDNQETAVLNLQVGSETTGHNAPVPMFVFEAQGVEGGREPTYVSAESYENPPDNVVVCSSNTKEEGEQQYLLTQDPATKEFYLTVQSAGDQDSLELPRQNVRFEGQTIEIISSEECNVVNNSTNTILDPSAVSNVVYAVNSGVEDAPENDNVAMVIDDDVEDAGCEEAGSGLQHIITAIQNIADQSSEQYHTNSHDSDVVEVGEKHDVTQ